MKSAETKKIVKYPPFEEKRGNYIRNAVAQGFSFKKEEDGFTLTWTNKFKQSGTYDIRVFHPNNPEEVLEIRAWRK